MPEYLIHRDGLFKVDKDTVEQIAFIDSDAFLATNGALSWVSNKLEDQSLSEHGVGTAVEIHYINSLGHLGFERKFDLLKTDRIKTTALSGNAVYVTGKIGDSILGFFDIREDSSVFIPMEIPKQIEQKRFDDLLIDNQKLLAVDNIVFPKWLVVYDISNSTSPKLIDVIELMKGISEHVLKGAVGDYYLSLFCEGFHRLGRYQTVQIYDKRNNYSPLFKALVWQEDGNSMRGSEDTDSKFVCLNPCMSFVEDYLLIPGDDKRVKVLDCSKDTVEEDAAIPQLMLYNNEGNKTFVVDAVAVPNSNKIIVWLDGDRNPIVTDIEKIRAGIERS